MKTIYKYELNSLVEGKWLVIQQDAVLRCAQEQFGGICIWAEVDTAKPLTRLQVLVLGTGHQAPSDFSDYTYLSTVQIGPFVWHVYYR